MLTQLIIFIASGAYTGYSPFASGTVGTLVGILLYLIFPANNWFLYLLLTIALFLIGCWTAGEGEKIFNAKDSGYIVIDEIVGFLVVMFLVPRNWWYLGAGFFVFRLLDIIKPWPANALEKVPGGWGIMLDDVAAGVYANLMLQLAWFVLQNWR